MFFTYLRRELRRRRKAALVVASGLALGIALVIVVTSVSSGMNTAQDKVLQSLYGLGTDMTVTKAATPTGSSSQRPRFQFDAKGSDDDSKQSSDRVVVQGFTTLASTTVSKVGGQKGVSSAVGGLSLNVVKVSGQFTRGQFKQDPNSSNSSNSSGGQEGGPGGAGGGSTGQPQGEVQGGGANFDINQYTVIGTDVTKTGLGPLTSSKITSGRTFKTDETDAKVLVADSSYAKQKKYKVGSTVTIKSVKYKVIGIATATSGDSAANLYIPLKQAQTLAGEKNKVTTIYVKATDSQQIDTVKSAIQKNVSGTTVTTSADLAKTVSGSLSTASSLASNVGKWLSIAVLVAAFLVAGLLTSSAVSRRVREFGTLKALGWKSRRVTGQVVGEAMVNGLVGGALGIALGLTGAYVVTSISPTLQAQLGSSASSAGGAGGPGGGFGGPGRQAAKTLEVALTAPVSVSTIALAVALAVAGGLIAGAFGGWRASRLRPADALRRVE
ncbi:ABC transporter permease [Streptomyces sp. YIM S03343]